MGFFQPACAAGGPPHQTVIVSRLGKRDEAAFERFTAQHADTSMFLRSNARAGGLSKGLFFGAYDGRMMRGVLQLAGNGNLYPQSPDLSVLRALFDVARVDAPEFGVRGVLARASQARLLVEMIEAPANAVALTRDERIWALDLAHLFEPKPVADGRWKVRTATTADLPLLLEWNADLRIGGLGAEPGAELDAALQVTVRSWINGGSCLLLVVDGAPVSQAVYSALLPDQVQIGSVYTPPALRGRGYARGVVAAALLRVKAKGVRRSTLFTQNQAAEAAYVALGFRHTGDYHITLFRDPVRLGG
jgi:uncharacterized protein